MFKVGDFIRCHITGKQVFFVTKVEMALNQKNQYITFIALEYNPNHYNKGELIDFACEKIVDEKEIARLNKLMVFK